MSKFAPYAPLAMDAATSRNGHGRFQKSGGVTGLRRAEPLAKDKKKPLAKDKSKCATKRK